MIPNISNYAPFYIQRTGDAGAINIQTTYGITVMVHEYPLMRKVKEPYKNDWKDRNGDDEWNTVLKYEAFNLTLKCVIFTLNATAATARAEMKTAVRNFQNAIMNGEFKIWDDWTKFGFQKVRVEEFPSISEEDFDELDGHCRLIFDVVLKVNDPITDMVLSNGSIVTAS